MSSQLERRAEERREFRSLLEVAPYYPGQAPLFHQVRCCDISTNSMSFYAAEKPETQHIVCKFWGSDSDIQVLAEVVRAWPEETETGLSLRVACRFVRRLE